MNAPAEKPAAPPAPTPAKPIDQALREFLAARPLPGAILVLIAYAALPVAGLTVSSREDESFWAWASGILLAGAALPAAAVFFRRPWTHLPAGWLAWAGLVGVVLRALSTGAIPNHVPFAVYGALLVAGAGAARTPPAPQAARERRPESVEQWARENAEAIVIAFIMALVIRCFCIEVFKIPSSSMEPTLLGDSHPGCPYKNYHLERYPGGDRIMVTKFFYSLSDIRRYDVLVFKFPLNQPKNFIKRVVGLPGEELRIHGGNLYVRKPGETEFAIARRELRTQDSVWIDLARGHDFLDGSPGSLDDYWEAHPPAGAPLRADYGIQERALVTREREGKRGVLFRYSGRFQDSHYQEVGELRVAFDFELTSPQGQAFAEIANEFGRFELVLSTDGAGHLRWTLPGENPRKVTREIGTVRLEMDRRYRLELSVYDGLAIARVDGSKVADLEYIARRSDAKPPPGGSIGISFGSKDATFRVRKLAVGRDLYYKGKDGGGIREDVPIAIKPGHYVMMGDNVDSSHDSRSWRLKRLPLTTGEVVELESQDLGNDKEVKIEDVMRRYGVEQPPDLFVPGDRHGTPWLLYRSEPKGGLPAGVPAGVLAKDADTEEPYPQIDGKYIVGKALWIWWPPGRWFTLIR
jgi:signal peptidase I